MHEIRHSAAAALGGGSFDKLLGAVYQVSFGKPGEFLFQVLTGTLRVVPLVITKEAAVGCFETRQEIVNLALSRFIERRHRLSREAEKEKEAQPARPALTAYHRTSSNHGDL